MRSLRALLLWLPVIAAPVRAAPPPTAPPRPAAPAPVGVFFEDFCADPRKAVCDTLLTSPLGREAQLLKLARELAQEAQRETGFNPRAQDPAALGRFQERLVALLRQRVGQAEWDAVQGHAVRVRRLLSEALDRTLPAAAADPLKAILDDVRVLDSTTLQRTLAGRDRNAASLARAYAQRCGEEGLNQNAFAISYGHPDRTDRYFIVCPGLLLSAAGRDARSNLENLLFVMGHELSHHFDADKQPAVYADYQRCLQARHAAALPGPLAPRMGEISADHWGTEVLLGYLAQGPAQSPRERLWALRQGLGALCGSADDGVHPSGDFRIGVLLRSHAGVIGAMRCSAPPDARACSLRGSQVVLTHPDVLFKKP